MSDRIDWTQLAEASEAGPPEWETVIMDRPSCSGCEAGKLEAGL